MEKNKKFVRAGSKEFVVGLLALGFVSAPAQSQAVIEEITVTAQRRESDMQQTPIALTAYNAEMILKAGINNVQEIGRFSPNVKMDLNRGGSQSGGPVFIRGVGQNDPLPGADPGVGVYIDGVYLGRSTGSMFDLVDIERVEVLRGPQGTLFGKNTIGGAISIVTKRPENEFSGTVGVEAGNYGHYRLRGSVNTPLVSDRLSVRMSAMKTERDGYTENSADGNRDVDSKDTVAGRLAVAAVVNQDVDLVLSLEGSSSRNGMVPGRQVTEGAVIASGNPDPFQGAYNLNGKAEFDYYAATANLTWDLGWGAFKSITGYRDLDDLATIDLDGSTAQIVEQISASLTQSQFSQEFQLVGDGLDGRLEWFTGLYYFEEESTYIEFDEIFGGLATLDLEVGTKNKSYAAFAHATYDISETLSLTAGLRYTYEDKALDIRFGAFGPESSSDNWDNVTPKLVLDYKLTEDNFVYLSAAKGFKSGQLNARARSIEELQPLDPENVWSYEFGSKNRFLEDRFQINLAAFYTEYSNIQVQEFAAAATDIGFIASNAGSGHMYGLEAEAVAVPVSGLTLSATLGLLYNGYDEYEDIAGNDLSDRDFANAPRSNFSLSADYEYFLGEAGILNFRADYNYQSEVFFEASNLPQLSEDGYSLLSGRITYIGAGERVQVSLFGKNLLDEEYLVNGLNVVSLLGGAGLGFFGPPRTYGLEVNYSF